MVNEGIITARLSTKGSVEGELSGEKSIEGKVGMGGASAKNALLYVEQNLNDEQLQQARKNLHIVGENVSGIVQTPYTVDEPNGYLYIYDEPVEAEKGAEIFNSYDGVSEYGPDKNIATGIMATAMGFRTQAIGNYSLTGGWWTRADGQCATAIGLLNVASGHFTQAYGTRTKATTNNAFASGDTCQATGRQSAATGQGTIASGFCSRTDGSGTEATNYYANAQGLGTIAAGRNQLALGKYNIRDTSSLLIVGKGSNKNSRSNAFTVSSAGAGWFASTVTSTGADYAELFEWADGNPDAEDRVGMVVTLDGDKIRAANKDDDVLGIVSGTAMVLGDNAAYEWKDKYVTDAYGRIVYNEPIEEFAEHIEYVDPTDPSTWVTVRESTGLHVYPKINPDYDPTRDYVSREDRKEWDAIGLLGKLHVNDDGTCKVNSYAKVGMTGMLTHSEERTNMRVMKRITDDVVLVLLK